MFRIMRIHKDSLEYSILIREQLKREIQDCQTASDIPRSIGLYLNCVDALYGENAENHIFKDILDWNTFEDATEPGLLS